MQLLFYNSENKLIAVSKQFYDKFPEFIRLTNKTYKQVHHSNVYIPFKSVELFSIDVNWQGN